MQYTGWKEQLNICGDSLCLSNVAYFSTTLQIMRPSTKLSSNESPPTLNEEIKSVDVFQDRLQLFFVRKTNVFCEYFGNSWFLGSQKYLSLFMNLLNECCSGVGAQLPSMESQLCCSANQLSVQYTTASALCFTGMQDASDTEGEVTLTRYEHDVIVRVTSPLTLNRLKCHILDTS